MGQLYAKISTRLHVIQWPRSDLENSCESGLFWPLKFEKIEKRVKIICSCTANLFTAKIAGFHCVHFPTALSLYFWHSVNACSGSLHSNWGAAKTCVYCGEKPAIFTTFSLQFLQLFHCNFLLLFYCIISRKNVVDQPGIEPGTFSMEISRSTNWSMNTWLRN